MLRTIGKTFGMAMASLCLVSTLAMAQSKPWVCTKVDMAGFCVEAKAPDEKLIVVKTEGVKIGEHMTCVTTGSSTSCTKVVTVK